MSLQQQGSDGSSRVTPKSSRQPPPLRSLAGAAFAFGELTPFHPKRLRPSSMPHSRSVAATYYGGSWLSAKMDWRYTLAEILAIGVAFPLAFFLLMYGVVRIVELIAKLRQTGQL
jgi:hypothetical protein